MKPAVLRPAARSRSRCNIGSRTSAWVPDRKIRFASSRYLSSSPTSINAMLTCPPYPCPAVLGTDRLRYGQHAPVLPGVHSPLLAESPHICSAFFLDSVGSLALGTCRIPPRL